MGRKYHILRPTMIFDNNGNPADGMFIGQHDKILLRKDLKGRELVEAFLHEINHAIQWRTGMFQAYEAECLEVFADTVAQYYAETFDIRYKKK